MWGRSPTASAMPPTADSCFVESVTKAFTLHCPKCGRYVTIEYRESDAPPHHWACPWRNCVGLRIAFASDFQVIRVTQTPK